MTTQGARLMLALGLGLAAFLATSLAVTVPGKTVEPPALTAAQPGPTHRILLSDEARLQAATEKGAAFGEIRSLLRVAAPLRYGQFVWDERNVAPGPLSIRVDLKAQTISAFRGGHEIGVAVILYGADGKPTPRGTFAILAKSKDHQSNQYDASMPYSLWLTSDGVAIHGSSVRWGSATHGCVGIPLDFAAKLFGAAHVGDRVDIDA